MQKGPKSPRPPGRRSGLKPDVFVMAAGAGDHRNQPDIASAYLTPVDSIWKVGRQRRDRWSGRSSTNNLPMLIQQRRTGRFVPRQIVLKARAAVRLKGTKSHVGVVLKITVQRI